MVDWIRKRLNFTTLKYQSLYKMLDAIGLPWDNVCNLLLERQGIVHAPEKWPMALFQGQLQP